MTRLTYENFDKAVTQTDHPVDYEYIYLQG